MFQLGQKVRLRTGEAAMEILKIRPKQQQALVVYCSSIRGGYAGNPKWRDFEDLVPFNQRETTMAHVLYETKDGKFGILLTKNSQGKFVLEMKGSSEVLAFDPEDLTEVTPYTVEIHFHFDSGGKHHMEVPEGKLEKGDIVYHGSNIGWVVALDTKCRRPADLGSGKQLRKVVTELVQ